MFGPPMPDEGPADAPLMSMPETAPALIPRVALCKKGGGCESTEFRGVK